MNKAPKDTFLGRCKKCKAAYRLVAPITRRVEAQLGYGRTERKVYRQLPDGSTQEGYSTLWIKCSCGRPGLVELGLIVGSTSTKHVCGKRCLNATGPSCECSCSGENHGSGHAHV